MSFACNSIAYKIPQTYRAIESFLISRRCRYDFETFINYSISDKLSELNYRMC
jgi:hypothetical protein